MNPVLRILQPKKALLADMRVAGRIVSDVLRELALLSKPATSLDMLDELAERMIRERGGLPYNKGYHPTWSETPYPSTIVANVNDEACHAPPGGRTLQNGDIVTYDLGVRYRGGCGDAALTVPVGEASNRKLRTLRYAKRALYNAIRTVRAGAPISDIGKAVDATCLMYNFRTIKEFGGHHIGREMHLEPQVPNDYRPANDNVFLQEGAVICIEPMLTPGNGKIGLATDKWTIFMVDQQPVAMFEHMVLVTKDGYELLTNHITEEENI